MGGSIEDWDPERGLYDAGHAAERVAAAVEAARALAFPFTLTARAENHIRGNPDLDDTIARLQAYEAAGADVLYAPGLRTTEEIRAVCDAVGRPVNVLARPDLTMRDIAEAGARRVSVGGALTWVAVAALAAAAERIRDAGRLLRADLAPAALGVAARLTSAWRVSLGDDVTRPARPVAAVVAVRGRPRGTKSDRPDAWGQRPGGDVTTC